MSTLYIITVMFVVSEHGGYKLSCGDCWGFLMRLVQQFGDASCMTSEMTMSCCLHLSWYTMSTETRQISYVASYHQLHSTAICTADTFNLS